jgi:CDP-glucose 4,6-dehydratase
MGNLVANNDYYSVFAGKRVLLTGDTGFKGSWLALWLSELGADVVGYALPPEHAEDHFNLLGLDGIIHHVDGDIRDLSAMKRIADEFRPEFVFHLAAQSLVKLSYEEPKGTFDTNVGGSVNLLEVVRSTPSVRSVIYVTSDKCYKNKEWVWGYRENDELGGRDPYSASKAAAEIVLAAYADSFFRGRERFGIASVRAGNVIGGGDWATDRIVPDCVRALHAGKPIGLRNPHATRPWQHVLEPLAGYLKLAAELYADPGRYSGSWNFGPRIDSIRTVGELAELIVSEWGGGSLAVQPEANAVHEATLLNLNCDKAITLLGWQPRWNFSRTVAATIGWYKKVNDGASALTVSRDQLKQFREDTV